MHNANPNYTLVCAQPSQGDKLPPRTESSNAAVHEVMRIVESHGVGKSQGMAVAVLERDTGHSPAGNRFVVGFSGGQEGLEAMLDRENKHGVTLRNALQSAGFTVATTQENLINPSQSRFAHGIDPDSNRAIGYDGIDENTGRPIGQFSRSCAEPRVFAQARLEANPASGAPVTSPIVGLSTNWYGKDNPYPIAGSDDPQAMEPCRLCNANQDLMTRGVPGRGRW